MVDFELHWGLRPQIISYNGKVVLDLGADWGRTAEFFLSHGAIKVIAIEGDPELAAKLVNNYKNSKKVIPTNFFIKKPEDIESLILMYSPDIVKVDIEGYEKCLLEMDHKIIQSVKEWMVEYHSDEIKDKIIDFFQSLYYMHTIIPYMCNGKWWVSHFQPVSSHKRKVLEWINKHGKNIKGYVLHVGSGIDKNNMRRYFPKITTYKNLDRFRRENVDIVADIQNMPVIASGFTDCVLATEMIYIVPDTNAALRELYRILKTNGILFISFLTKGYPWVLGDESHRFTREETINLLTNNKFTIIELDEYETNIMVVAKKCC